MVGRVLALAAALGGPLYAATPKKASKAHAAPSLHVRSIDRARRVMLIEVAGVSRAPAPNLFRFTDVRGRHYVAMSAHCDEPFPSGTRACELEIPSGYERHRLIAVELHLGGLHSRTVAAAEAEVAAAWSAALDSSAEVSAAVLPAASSDANSRAATGAPDGGARSDGGR